MITLLYKRLSAKKLENLLESKPDVLIVHVGTDDLPKNIKA